MNINNKTEYIPKEHFRNTVCNIKNTERRRLKSINCLKAGSVQAKSKNDGRYEEEDKENQCINIQYPTFGDWKSQIPKVVKENRQSLDYEKRPKQRKLSYKTLSPSQKQKTQERANVYEQNRIREIAETVKMKNKSLYPIQNILTRKFKQEEPKQNIIQRDNKIKSKAFSKELHTNFDSIQYNLHKIVNRKQIFKTLYLRQKQKYEQILRKHNINQKVDDSQFEKYFNS